MWADCSIIESFNLLTALLIRVFIFSFFVLLVVHGEAFKSNAPSLDLAYC